MNRERQDVINDRQQSRTARRALAASALGLALLWATCAKADVKAGVDAWSAGDYDAAIAQWRPLAQKGDPDALFNLAQAYKLGRGVPVDLARAKELYGKAAAQGHVQAADNYGLLLFQDGERAKAMPYIKAAADRGDARAQYILGIAHFNGDLARKDWVKAYALLTLARQAELPQANKALAQMDGYIPLAQRQQAVALSRTMASTAAANRERVATARELSVPEDAAEPASAQMAATTPQRTAPLPTPPAASTANALAEAARIARGASPAEAGADYARPRTATPPRETRLASAAATPARPAAQRAPSPLPVSQRPAPKPAPAPVQVSTQPSPTPSPQPAPRAKPSSVMSGPWELQLGAFGVAGNAERLWQRVRARPEIEGHAKRIEMAGRLHKLLIIGYASRSDADTACAALKAGGFDCLVTRS